MTYSSGIPANRIGRYREYISAACLRACRTAACSDVGRIWNTADMLSSCESRADITRRNFSAFRLLKVVTSACIEARQRIISADGAGSSDASKACSCNCYAPPTGSCDPVAASRPLKWLDCKVTRLPINCRAGPHFGELAPLANHAPRASVTGERTGFRLADYGVENMAELAGLSGLGRAHAQHEPADQGGVRA